MTGFGLDSFFNTLITSDLYKKQRDIILLGGADTLDPDFASGLYYPRSNVNIEQVQVVVQH